jgi:formate dehydrogenase major subunit
MRHFFSFYCFPISNRQLSFLLKSSQLSRLYLSRVGKSHGGKTVLNDLLSRWPLIQQIKTGADGNGPESMSEKTRALRPKHDGAEVARSICPYCGVGCGQVVYHKNGKLISIEGDAQSPISRGHLCPKGAATFELHTHPGRLKKVKYRRPYAKQWEELDLETAMDIVADRLWDSRNRTFQETKDGEVLMQTKAVAHLGGATLDDEENYLIRKLFTLGLGMVCISNQARI